MAESITFLNGIAQRRHHTQIRNGPWAMFFYGVGATKKQTASALGYPPSVDPGEFLPLQVRGATGPRRVF